MSQEKVQVYSYRWIVLLLFIFPNITIQVLWISFASVTSTATVYYGVDDLSIYLLSLSFMLVYIPVTFLSSWFVDKYGFKKGAGLGGLLAGVFGLLRVFAFHSFPLVLIFQIIIAIGQPFLLNCVTKCSANWFPEDERSIATGLGMIAGYIGIALGMFITPLLVAYTSFEVMLLIYGVISLLSGVLFVVFARDMPPTPSTFVTKMKEFNYRERLSMLFKDAYFLILIAIFFIGSGIFNTIMTYIEAIVLPRGFDSIFAGLLGGLILVGGIVGSFIMSFLSDRFHRKKVLIIISIAISSISMLLISLSHDRILLLISGVIFGFGAMSAAPVALEYAVDITTPVPEQSSNGILMMVGQIGGMLLIILLEDMTTPSGDYFPALFLQFLLLLALLALSFFLKEKKNKAIN
ncbi:MAG: MFS transporter [Promethearchaeota archaeon]